MFDEITEDVKKFAAKQILSDEEALRRDMDQKSREFTQAGAEGPREIMSRFARTFSSHSLVELKKDA
jgi:hypothetical protein